MGLLSINIAYADFDSFLGNVDAFIINPLIELLFALAVVYFLYGVLQFILNQDNEEKKTTGKNHMIWGIVGIAIMMGVWTILGIIGRTFPSGGVEVDKNNQRVDVHITP